MISVHEAKSLVLSHTPPPVPVRVPLERATGLVLAEDIFSPLDIPPFRQSSMDGYAFRWEGFRAGTPLPVTGTVQAGATSLPAPGPGEAVRIFTGAPVPEGADTVVMQEKVEVSGTTIRILDPGISPGDNVRPRGSQTAGGDLVLKAGVRLGPGSVGLLAGLGLTEINVFGTPRTGILLTGRELVPPGHPLQPGQVYESNSFSLRAALSEAGIAPHLIANVDDEPEQTFEAIASGLASCQLLLVTGGISVGDYDFVHGALRRNGVETIFYKVKQKPGKPLYCGRRGDTLVFGLPGNPGSVLSCFYQYVVPAIRIMTGRDPGFAHELYRKLAGDFTKNPGLTHFVKGRITGDEVTVLHAQESYKMNAFSESDCLIQLDEDRDRFRKGEPVQVYPLNQFWQ